MKDMRPTTGKVMLALFNILGNISGCAFLDLFSGSGQIAAAAVKKGASSVVCVETERKRYADIVKKVPREVRCLCMDVRRALPLLVKKNEKFNIIFADPPYLLGWGDEFPRLLAQNSEILAESGTVVFEHSAEEKAAVPDGWECSERTYGGTVLAFYGRKM